ncbi:MAG: DNA methyltransferase [Thermoprotei archaeon]
MSSVGVFVKPAQDFPELNLSEAKALSTMYAGEGGCVLNGEFVFKAPVNKALRLISRVCGSREAGLYFEELAREDLPRAIRLATNIIGPRRFKVAVQQWDRDLVSEIVSNMFGSVDFRSPEVILKITTEGGAYKLKIVLGTARVELSRLQPKNWVYFHPGALQPYFCGIMCNLAACPDGGVLLDPFCGVGSTIVAASHLGLNAVGCDISKKQVYGCRRNAFYLKLGGVLGVLRADAASLPLKRGVVDAAVFDPPYGKVSSLFGRSFEGLLANVAEGLWQVLKPGGYACFFTPFETGLDVFVSRGFKLTYTYTIRVHRKLTRVLTVMKKVL